MIDGWAGCGPDMTALCLPAARVFHLKWLPEHWPTNHLVEGGCHINYLVHPRQKGHPATAAGRSCPPGTSCWTCFMGSSLPRNAGRIRQEPNQSRRTPVTITLHASDALYF